MQAIGNTFKTMWTVAKTILKQIYDAFSSLGTVIEGVFTLDPKKIKEGWKNGMSAIKDNAVNLAKEIGKNAVNAIDNTINGEMKEISLDLGDASEAGVGYGANRNRNGGGGGTTTSEDTGGGSGGGGGTSSAASKAAQDELRVLEQLEESKIALIQNSHEKEIATIRMNYKKKLDAITGESESEQQLRVNIAEQCEQAVGECELKYQQQIAQTNLANRLAIVEKGSQEELTLRLAQIEANRAKELAAAEKSGADLELINEKFNQQRQALEEEYAAKRAEAIESSYTRQSEITNNEHLAAVNALKNRYAEELKVTKDATATMAQYKKELAQLDEEYTRQTAQNTIEMLEEMLKEEQLSDADREKYESELAKAKISLESDMADAAIESAEESANADDDANKKRIENVMSWVQKAGEAFSKVTDLMTQLYDNEISRIEDEIDANTEAGEAEEERITDLVDKKVITEEEGEARKRAAEAETSKKEEELQKKKEALELKQAKWDKANSLAQAGIATALAITKALPNLVLAAIAASMGAVQIATIAATPLATYAKGTDFHEGGPAVVGDGGRAEVVMYRGNAWLTPDTPTIVDLPRGAAVIPSVEQLVMPMSSLQALPATATMVNAKSYNDTAMRKDVSEIATLIRRQTARQHADAYWLKYEMYKQRI